MSRVHFLLGWLGIAAVALITASPAIAQSFPSQPVKLIVPFPPASATDTIARQIGNELQGTLGQPFVVENKPGAQGVIGAEAVARSAPDGYTLMVAAVSFAATEALMKKLPYDIAKDFTPIDRIVTTPLVLMVKKDFPARTLQEFIDVVKARPGKVSAGYGSSSSQVCIAQLKSMAKLDVLEVPYKGIPLAVNDLLGGAIDFSFVDLSNALAQAKGGNLRALGVTTEKRSALVPDWPALAEVLPGYDIDAWIAMIGPKGLPKEIAQKLHEATLKALAKPELQAKLAAVGFTPAALPPEQMPAFMKSEVDKWTKLVKQAGIVPE
jgi:tripartite-type tricarboxylate transporter receptor subunit TctC